MSDYLTYEVYGWEGSYWCIGGPDAGDQGVTLAPGATKLLDAPVKTMWTKSAFGQRYEGKKVQRRDPVLALNIEGDDPDDWHEVDSRIRMAFDYDTQTRIVAITSDGPRTLWVRLLEDPVASAIADKDPHLWAQSRLTLTLAAEQPYWEAEDSTSTWTLASGTAGSGQVAVFNDGDVEVWLQYVCTGPTGTYTLPDYSFIDDVAATRTLTLPTLVPADGDLTVDTGQEEEQLVTTNKTPIWNRWSGNGFLFPLPPHTGTRNDPVLLPVSVTGGAAGISKVQVRNPHRYSRAWGVIR